MPYCTGMKPGTPLRGRLQRIQMQIWALPRGWGLPAIQVTYTHWWALWQTRHVKNFKRNFCPCWMNMDDVMDWWAYTMFMLAVDQRQVDVCSCTADVCITSHKLLVITSIKYRAG